MKKILLSFIGNNDCLLSQGKEGAIISILKEREFDVLYVLYNDNSYLKYASEILLFCKKHYPKLLVRYQEAISINPINYNIVYPAMVSAVNSILAEQGVKDTEYTISLTSGTPTMHSCWILIVLGGIIKAKLIQASREEGIQDLTFALDDFPKLNSEKQLKIELTKTARENKILKKQMFQNYPELVGEHESIIKVKQTIDNLVKYDITVFIGGESGTGKEVVARLLHYNGNRKEKPFIAVNCGSVNENLAESEFFGHKRGSFTGAFADHEGYFGLANGGTLFLDELGDLPLPLQGKLLRALQDGVIQTVGSGSLKKVNVNVISASNKDLKKMVKEGSFREDLYYRLVQAELYLPPLRDRGSDIIILARHFLQEFSVRNQYEKRFGLDAEKKLLNYYFPGNVRQLQNLVKLAYINSQSVEITASDIILPLEENSVYSIEIPSEGVDFDDGIIPAYYQAALRKANGNASEAARLLSLKPHTLRARLKSLSIGNDYEHK